MDEFDLTDQKEMFFIEGFIFWFPTIFEMKYYLWKIFNSINQLNSEKVQEPFQYLAKNEKSRFKFGLLAGSLTSMEGLTLTIGDTVVIQ